MTTVTPGFGRINPAVGKLSDGAAHEPPRLPLDLGPYRVPADLSFTVPAVPIAQPRQRSRVVKTRDGREFTHNYTPTRHPVNEFKAAVKLAFNAKHQGPPLTGILGIAIDFVMPRPASLVWKTKAMPRVHRSAGRTDWDNLAKAFTDALNGLAWRDDSQVCRACVDLWIASGDEAPHVEARIYELE